MSTEKEEVAELRKSLAPCLRPTAFTVVWVVLTAIFGALALALEYAAMVT